MKFVKVQLVGGKIPTKGTPGSAAWDLYAPAGGVVWPNSSETIPLGLKMELKNCAGILSHRSGHNSEDWIQAYGLVDPDYRGELLVVIHNSGMLPFRYKEGDRIAQLRLVEVPDASLLIVDKLEETERGENGHGSTGN